MPPKRDPRDFADTPGVARRKRGAAVDAILGDTPGTPDLSDTSDTPIPPHQPDKAEQSGVPDTPDKSAYKRTRQSKTGETVKRATFWLTEEDLTQIEALQRRITITGVSGVPDKSAIVREAIRRLASDAEGA